MKNWEAALFGSCDLAIDNTPRECVFLLTILVPCGLVQIISFSLSNSSPNRFLITFLSLLKDTLSLYGQGSRHYIVIISSPSGYTWFRFQHDYYYYKW